jgi:hypothetical protein
MVAPTLSILTGPRMSGNCDESSTRLDEADTPREPVDCRDKQEDVKDTVAPLGDAVRRAERRAAD